MDEGKSCTFSQLKTSMAYPESSVNRHFIFLHLSPLPIQVVRDEFGCPNRNKAPKGCDRRNLSFFVVRKLSLDAP